MGTWAEAGGGGKRMEGLESEEGRGEGVVARLGEAEAVGEGVTMRGR